MTTRWRLCPQIPSSAYSSVSRYGYVSERVTTRLSRSERQAQTRDDLLEAAAIRPYEQVHLVNLNNGERWITYAIPQSPEHFL